MFETMFRWPFGLNTSTGLSLSDPGHSQVPPIRALYEHGQQSAPCAAGRQDAAADLGLRIQEFNRLNKLGS